jgi:hypothetical protein
MDSINNKVNENIPFFQGQFRDFCKKVEQFAEHLMKCARDKNLKYDWEAFNALRKEKGKLALRITELYDKYDQAQKANYYKKAENYHNQIKKLEDQHSKLPYDITAPEKGCILFSYLNNSYPDINKKEDGIDYPLQQFWVTPKVVNPLSWFMKGTPENLSEENRLMYHCVILSVVHDYNENMANADQRIYRHENYTGRFKRDRFCSNLWYKLSNDQERVNRSLQFVIKYLDSESKSIQTKAKEPESPGPKTIWDQSGGEASKVKHAGRKPLNQSEAEERYNILDKWREADKAGISRNDFCNDKNITIKKLEKYQAWERKRTDRAG